MKHLPQGFIARLYLFAWAFPQDLRHLKFEKGVLLRYSKSLTYERVLFWENFHKSDSFVVWQTESYIALTQVYNVKHKKTKYTHRKYYKYIVFTFIVTVKHRYKVRVSSICNLFTSISTNVCKASSIHTCESLQPKCF